MWWLHYVFYCNSINMQNKAVAATPHLMATAHRPLITTGEKINLLKCSAWNRIVQSEEERGYGKSTKEMLSNRCATLQKLMIYFVRWILCNGKSAMTFCRKFAEFSTSIHSKCEHQTSRYIFVYLFTCLYVAIAFRSPPSDFLLHQ